VVLRLAYHDAATFSTAAGNGGANASIQYELGRPENTGLKRGWRLIEQVGACDRLLLRGSPAFFVFVLPKPKLLAGKACIDGDDDD
jgi:hypothetical protein